MEIWDHGIWLAGLTKPSCPCCCAAKSHVVSTRKHIFEMMTRSHQPCSCCSPRNTSETRLRGLAHDLWQKRRASPGCVSGDSWMYSYQCTPIGNPYYISPIARGNLWVIILKNPYKTQHIRGTPNCPLTVGYALGSANNMFDMLFQGKITKRCTKHT